MNIDRWITILPDSMADLKGIILLPDMSCDLTKNKRRRGKRYEAF